MAEAVLARHHVTVIGSAAQSMVFAHGFGCDQHMWRFIEPAFRMDYRTVCFDYVGCGQSDRADFDPKRYSRLDGYAQDLIDVTLAAQATGAVFVGHSVRGLIGVRASLKRPDLFSRLVLVSPSPRYLNDQAEGYVGGFEEDDVEGLLQLMDHNYIGWAGTLAPMVMGNADRPGLTDELQRSFCSTDPKAARVFARTTFFGDNRADLAQVRLPTLILQVQDDAIAPVAVGEYMHRMIPGSELVVLPATGHCPHMSHPEMTLAAIQRFVDHRRE
jgi:sigma-B regulation protein RsbQ